MRLRTASFVIIIQGFAAAPAEARNTTTIEAAADIRAQWLRMPPIDLSERQFRGVRTFPGAPLPSAGTQMFAGVALEFGLVRNDRLTFPIFGAVIGSAIGESRPFVASSGGAFIELRPWTTWMATALLPGVGVRFKKHRWQFAAHVRPVITIVSTTIARSGESPTSLVESETFTTAFGARAEVEACRRLDPIERVCIFAAPSIYEFSFASGGSLGLRWEVGL